jgi:hypothetical protein
MPESRNLSRRSGTSLLTVFFLLKVVKGGFVAMSVVTTTPSDPYYSSLIRMFLSLKCV